MTQSFAVIVIDKSIVVSTQHYQTINTDQIKHILERAGPPVPTDAALVVVHGNGYIVKKKLPLSLVDMNDLLTRICFKAKQSGVAFVVPPFVVPDLTEEERAVLKDVFSGALSRRSLCLPSQYSEVMKHLCSTGVVKVRTPDDWGQVCFITRSLYNAL